MATIVIAAVVDAPVADVWAGLANFGEVHRIFSGVLSDCRLDGAAERLATFANGLVVRERIISVDAEHNASLIPS